MRRQLLFLPGMLCDHAVWNELIKELGEAAECKVVDYGHENSLSGMAHRACELVSGPTAVVGHSMGGRVALQVQRLIPDRVTHLGLLNTSASGHESLQDKERERGVREKQLHLARREGLLSFARSWSREVFAPTSLENRILIESFEAMVAGQTIETFEAQVSAGLNRPDMRSWLNAIQSPTLVIGGALEKARPPTSHIAIADAISGGICSIVPGSAHMTNMEQPIAVARLLRVFLGLS
jgi:pimeloyl-ACP methyl ester carboxylesterase